MTGGLFLLRTKVTSKRCSNQSSLEALFTPIGKQIFPSSTADQSLDKFCNQSRLSISGSLDFEHVGMFERPIKKAPVIVVRRCRKKGPTSNTNYVPQSSNATPVRAMYSCLSSGHRCQGVGNPTPKVPLVCSNPVNATTIRTIPVVGHWCMSCTLRQSPLETWLMTLCVRCVYSPVGTLLQTDS